MSTRKAGTSGSTKGDRNEGIPAPKALALFTGSSRGGPPRVHDEVEAIKAARTLEGHGALGSHVTRARVRRKEERHDPWQAHLVEAVVDERASGLRRVPVTPHPRRELVRDLDLRAFSLDRKEPDLSEKLARLFQLESPQAEARRLTRREGDRARKTLCGLGDVLRWRARRPLHHFGRTEHLVQRGGIVVAVRTDGEPFGREGQRH